MFSTPIPLLTLALILSGCTTLPRYKDIEPMYSFSTEGKSSPSLVVHLESVFPGKPFDEVVCDNVVGAISSREESKKIGFTQNYQSFIAQNLPALLFEASLPYNIGGARVASGQSSLNLAQANIDSRIMVPFGALISSDLVQLLNAANKRSVLCLDKGCVEQEKRTGHADRIVTVRFTRFRVAEDRRNTLTLVVEGTANVEEPSGSLRSVTIKHQILERSITSEGLFHSDFLRVMNKIANEIASAVADQILASAL